MAEQFAVQDTLGVDHAVRLDERLATARRGLVEHPRGQSLAGSALAGQQDRGIGAGHLAQRLDQTLHRGRVTGQLLKRVVEGQLLAQLHYFYALGLEFLGQTLPLAPHFTDLAGPLGQFEQLGAADRLLQHVERTPTKSRKHPLHVGVTGEDHHQRLGLDPLDLT